MIAFLIYELSDVLRLQHPEAFGVMKVIGKLWLMLTMSIDATGSLKRDVGASARTGRAHHDMLQKRTRHNSALADLFQLTEAKAARSKRPP
jgi:hypothetical protein